MAFDKTLPSGSANIALGDDAIRANNEALDDALKLEHRFTTGGNQSGVHVFITDTTTNLDLLPNRVDVPGSIGFSSSERTAANPVLMYHDGTSFVPADVSPGNIPRTDAQNVYENTNWADVVSVTADIVAGELDIDLDAASYKTATVTSDLAIKDVTNDIADDVTVVFLELTMSGGPWAVTFGGGTTVWQAAFGVAPYISPNDGDINVLQLVKLATGKWLATAFAQIGNI